MRQLIIVVNLHKLATHCENLNNAKAWDETHFVLFVFVFFIRSRQGLLKGGVFFEEARVVGIRNAGHQIFTRH